MLNQHGVVASFFVVGRMAHRHPHLVRMLHQEGHEILNHSWSHPDIQRISKRRFRGELDRTRKLILDLTGIDTPLFRTPGSTKAYLQNHFTVPHGYQLVMWDVHSRDQEKKTTVQDIIDRVSSQVRDGHIILLHNGTAKTVDALDCLLPRLKADGYAFVTVSQLIEARSLSFVSSNPKQIVGG